MLIRQNFNRYLAEETISIDLVSTQKPEEPACLQANLSEAQYLTLQILILLLQGHRTVQLERLAALFPQPITFESRRRNLQRFLKLPQLSVKLLWFPLIKHIIKQEFSRKNKNRHQRRKLKKLRHLGHLLLVIDRTDWKGRNLFVASVICGKRALPVYWILLDKKGSSNLGEQKKFRSPCVKTLKILSSRRDRGSRISECSTRKVARRKGYSLYSEAKEGNIFAVIR